MNRKERRAREKGLRRPQADTLSRALACFRAGRLEEAARLCDEALARDATHTDALGLAGMIAVRRGEATAAVDYFQTKRDLLPGDGDTLNNLGGALRLADRLDEALEAYEAAVRLRPDFADAHENLGLIHRDRGHYEAAEAAFGRALESNPDHTDRLMALASVHRITGRAEAAVELYDRCLVLDPNRVDSRHARCLTLLGLGDFPAGLADFETRWRDTQSPSVWRDFPQAPWDGSALHGDGLLVWAEQGVGDHVLFSRLFPLASARGARLTVECDPRLVTLFARSFPDMRVVGVADPPDAALVEDDIAFQTPMGGLMAALAPWPHGFQPPRRSLVADAERKAALARRLDAIARGRARIGISWRSTRHRVGPAKTMPLSEWGPILEGQDALFVNLQYGETEAEVQAAMAATGAHIHTDPDLDRFDDLDGLAALIDGLDLVITTSNVTAHFAGALGKDCWLALQRSPLWYWGAAGAETLFYPTVTAYRQATADQWADVASALASALERRLENR